MTIEGNIDDAGFRIVEIGLYQNVYRDVTSGCVWVGVLYESPEEAQKNIMWHKPETEYLYTAKTASAIYKFDKP